MQVTLDKARKKTAALSSYFRNSRVPASAKTMVWLSYVRPVLEYGCEVWVPKAKEKDALESIHTQAGVSIFKLNEQSACSCTSPV